MNNIMYHRFCEYKTSQKIKFYHFSKDDRDENDELVFYRYKNGKNVELRKYMLKQIEEGKIEWKSLLDEFPLPDKPFNIEDIKDVKMKGCFIRILNLENELKELGDYINNNLGNTDMKNRIKKHFDEKYKV